jgi:CubicO group peptidase (beta-lactamase class C family)
MLLLVLFCLSEVMFAEHLPAGQPAELGISPERLARLDDVIEASISAEEIPGAVVLVARRGKTVYRKAFGLRSKEPDVEPMTIDSIFDIASLTKVIATATSIMILVEEGKIALNEPVSDFIPKFARRGKEKVTLLHLLTHHSGLRPDLDLDPKWKGYDKAIDLACRERLVADPGEQFIYSDINYVLLGEVVHRVSGMSLDQFAAERIFKPLGMVDTSFLPSPTDRQRLVPTILRDGEMLRGKVHDPTAARMGGVAGNAGVFSTVDDIAIWAQMLLNEGSYRGVRILSPLGALKMSTPQEPRSSPDWRGAGFDIETRFSTVRGDLFPAGSFGHSGYTGTSVWLDPFTETTVILFTSRLHPNGEGDVVALRSKVASVVAASLMDVRIPRQFFYQGY